MIGQEAAVIFNQEYERTILEGNNFQIPKERIKCNTGFELKKEIASIEVSCLFIQSLPHIFIKIYKKIIIKTEYLNYLQNCR